MTPGDLRAFVLGFPGVGEHSHHGKPDFRVAGKIAVNLDERGRTITVKLSEEQQAMLLSTLPVEAVSLLGGWAKHGWTTISLDHAPDGLIRDILRALLTHPST